MVQTRKNRWRYLWPVVAGAVPVILCLIFTLLQARQMVKRQLVTTSSMLMSQAENISTRAGVATAWLQKFQDRRCPDIEAELRRFGSLNPYFRSIGIVKNNTVICSSAFGEQQGPLTEVIGRPLPTHHGKRWSLSVFGTYGVPNRSAVLFVREGSDGFASYAVIDGQYLIDLIWAISVQHAYDISMKFGDGFAIFKGVPATQQTEDKPGYRTLLTYSAPYGITLSVTAPRSELFDNWREVLLSLMPMAIILSILFVALTVSWLRRRNSLGDEIRRGIARNEFSVNYQPVYSIESGAFSGVEALMRWQRSDGRWVRPDVFIAAAESEKVIVPLTQHLLQRVVRDSAQWKIPPGFHVAINMAAEHLQHDDFMADVRAFAASMAHLSPAITLELTERSLIDKDRTVAGRLAELRNDGIFIAIDDFGTGHCSLSYLQNFPLDYLKIDRGFVNAIESVESETPVLDTIIQLADKLKLKVVAEGVENDMQLRYLQRHGVPYLQGYHLARPMDNAALLVWMQEQADAQARHQA